MNQKDFPQFELDITIKKLNDELYYAEFIDNNNKTEKEIEEFYDNKLKYIENFEQNLKNRKNRIKLGVGIVALVVVLVPTLIYIKKKSKKKSKVLQ